MAVTDVLLRELGETDASRVAGLYRAAASVARSGLSRGIDEITDDYVRGFMRRAVRDGIILGAFLGEAIVGEIHGLRFGPRQFDHVLGELTVAVDPKVQGQGIGTALFAALIAKTASMVPTVTRIELTARSGNVGALRLYERLGFVREGRLVGRVLLANGTVEDDIVMARIA